MLLTTTVLCGWLIYVTSHDYMEEQRQTTRPLILALLGAVAVGATWIISQEFRPGLGRRLARARLPFALACVFVAAACLWAYAVRPVHDRTESLRAEWSWSLRWLVDWFGIVLIALAVGGLLLLLRRALRSDVVAAALVVLVGPLAVIYLWEPHVAPDQPWAMRRFLPVVIPGLVIGAAVALQALTRVACRCSERRIRIPALLIVVGLTVATLVPSALAAGSLVEARAQHGALAAVKTLCRRLPDDAAVVFYRASHLGSEMTQTIRGFCEVPTAGAPTRPNLDITSLRRAWGDADRTLFIVTTSPRQIERETSGNARVVVHLEIDDRYAPQRTYRVRPRRFEPQPREVWLMRMAPTR